MANWPLLGGVAISSVVGYDSFGVWNPSTNALTVYRNMMNLGAFTLTGDRSLIVVGTLTAPALLCTLDPETGKEACTNHDRVLNSLAITPDGKSILLTGIDSSGLHGEVLVYDAKTLTQTAVFPVAGDVSGARSLIVSPDSTTLYMSAWGIVYAYNLASGAEIGWTPNVTVEPIYAGLLVGPAYEADFQASDNTGLIAGPMEEGVGFVDTANLQTGPVGFNFTNEYIFPATGPAAGGTVIRGDGGSLNGNKLTAVYVGGNPATSLSQTDTVSYATTPPGPPGPVDVYAAMSNGGLLIAPEGFSYGPTILEVTPDAATAEGGGTGFVYGYGFGSTEEDSPIPADLQITVGGKQVAVTAYVPNAYGVEGPPFNLQGASYTIPPGIAGASADVVVTTPSGTATAALHYLPAVQQFALSGAQLAEGIYDAKRNLYYFTDTSQIRVFSLSQGQWLSSIQVPAGAAGATHRLWGIALSPDGSKLAVTDTGTALIYLVNPDAPGSVQSFSAPLNETPVGLAVSNTGMVYFAARGEVGGISAAFFTLDTGSGTVTKLNVNGVWSNLFKVAITSDSSTVFFNEGGIVFSVDTATGKLTYDAEDAGCCFGDYDLTLSADQTTLESNSYLYDRGLNGESYLSLTVRESLGFSNIAYVYGTKLSPDGSLLFQPSTNGIDVYDGRRGTLRQRISLPFALSSNYDALVSDGKDNVLIAITGQNGSGIAVVDLSSLAVPAPLPYLQKLPDQISPSLLGSGGAAREQRVDVDSTIPAGRRFPGRVVKHIANEALPLPKSAAVALSTPVK